MEYKGTAVSLSVWCTLSTAGHTQDAVTEEQHWINGDDVEQGRLGQEKLSHKLYYLCVLHHL